jgi:Protein of unknown function (DUF3892)
MTVRSANDPKGSKAMLQQITKVRTQAVRSGDDHITMVQLATGVSISRETVISNLRSVWGDRYYTLGGGARADVIVGRCPRCSAGDYITTAPDYTTANNLLHLPRF